MGDAEHQEQKVGRYLALGVGLSCITGAAYVILTDGAPVIATILTLIGASALSGWLKARKKRPDRPA